ncbi:MAG: Hsp70 family protein, partial [Clostridia bacterium]|nr:Hsp70 family protein [Clostridia bacterium]
EKYAAEDKARKEEVETFNHADNLIYQTEKTMKELGDKIDPADKSRLEDELGKFRKVREGNNAAEIKTAMEAFTQLSYEIFGKVYQQQGGPQGDPNAQGAYQQQDQGGYQQGTNDDGTVESSFTDENN